jgi:outer membrane protein OmpA-like peptidoglycan-associated protein
VKTVRNTILVAAGLSLALVVACAKPLPTEPPLSVSPLVFAAGEARKPDHVVVITDGSGTMYARQTFPLAKALTQSFVRGMPDASAPAVRDDYIAALMGFGGDERLLTGPAPFDRGLLSDGAGALTILGSIDGMGGRTPFRDVFAETAAMLPMRGEGTEPGDGPHNAAIVIFSDGLPDWPDRALASGAMLVGGFNGEVCFHTVQTGSDPAGTEFLAALSQLTPCGSHRMAESVRDPAAFMTLERDVFAGAAAGDDACGRLVRLQGVTFDFDKYDVKPESAVVLDVAAEQLRQCPEVGLRIEGHTDWIGTEKYNQGLSERRAKSVADYLRRAGVKNQMGTLGYGETMPIAPNAKPDGTDDPEGRARNRRVELHPKR